MIKRMKAKNLSILGLKKFVLKLTFSNQKKPNLSIICYNTLALFQTCAKVF